MPEVGDCFDVRKDEPDLRDSLVSCDDEHDDEVYAEFDLPDSDYPGDSAVLEAANVGCIERFAPFVGVAYDASVLELTTYQPSAETWAVGERRVICIVWHPSTSVVGSLQGAAI